jgi:hypothetical protein
MQCLGYGLKLSWPRANDPRRFAEGHQHRILTIRSRKLEFINATSQDVEVRPGARRIPARRGHPTKSVTQNDRLDSMARQLLRAPIPRDPHIIGMANFDPYLNTNRKYCLVLRKPTLIRLSRLQGGLGSRIFDVREHGRGSVWATGKDVSRR